MFNPDDVAEVSPSVDKIALRRPPFWSFGMVALATLSIWWLIDAARVVVPQLLQGNALREVGAEVASASIWLVMAAGIMARRWYVQTRPLLPIRFHADFVDLPRNLYALGRRRIPYGEILSVYLGGHPPHLRLLLESRRHILHLDQLAFVDAEGPERFFAELRRRILGLPNGRDLIEAMRRRQTIAGRALATRPIVTQALLGVMTVFFLNQYLLGALQPLELLGWGASSAPLVRDGEYFRLLAANFLHVHPLHILLNGVALLSLGGVMERFLGAERFSVVYGLSGIGATVASVLMGGLNSAGASGCVFGLLGGLAVVNWRYRTALPLGLRQPLRWWVFILLINGLLPLLVPVIDVAGHIGGFLVGALVTWAVLERGTEIRPAAQAPASVRILALALAAAYAVALGCAVWFARSYNTDKELEYAVRLARELHKQPENWVAQNLVAWTIAIHPQASGAQAALARDAAARAVAVESDEDMVRDTLATLHFRLGDVDRAIAEQRRILEAASSGRFDKVLDRLLRAQEITYASQLARFLAAQNRPLIDAVTFAVDRPTGASGELRVTVAEAQPDGFTAYALVQRDAATIGLVQVRAGSTEATTLTHATASDLDITPTDTLVPVLFERRSALPRGDTQWGSWPVTRAVWDYPGPIGDAMR